MQHGHVTISAFSSVSPVSSAFSHQFLVKQEIAGRTMAKEDKPKATRNHELGPRKHNDRESLH
jgi:hypothetical protein